MQPKAGPKTQRDLGVRMPSSHPKETGKVGCLGGPQLAGPGSCPARLPSCPDQNPLWVRAPRPATQRERT